MQTVYELQPTTNLHKHLRQFVKVCGEQKAEDCVFTKVALFTALVPLVVLQLLYSKFTINYVTLKNVHSWIFFLKQFHNCLTSHKDAVIS